MEPLRNAVARLAIMPVVVCAVWCATSIAETEGGTGVNDLLKLEGKELVDAARGIVGHDGKTDYTSAELIQVLRAFPVEQIGKRGAIPWLDEAFRQVFRAACQQAKAEDVDALVRIYVACPSASSLRETLLFPVAARWIERELAAIATERHSGPAFPDAKDALPDYLQDAPKKVQEVWRKARAITAPHRVFRSVPDEKRVPFTFNEKAFQDIIDRVLTGKMEDGARRMAQFYWDQWKGEGSAISMMSKPQDLIILISLLRERRLAEAAGAAVFVGWDVEERDRAKWFDLRKRLWDLCGVDWEVLFVGWEVDRNQERDVRDPHLLELLGAYGSADAARLFISALPFIEVRSHGTVSRAIGLFLAQPDAASEALFLYSRAPWRTHALPDDVHLEVLKTLVSEIWKTQDFDEAEELASLLNYPRRSDYGDLVRPLLGHPAEAVAETAAKVLSMKMGEEVRIPARSAPVAFQLFLNGETFKSQMLNCTLHTVNGEDDYGVPVQPLTDERGIVTVERRYFTNPARPVDRILFSVQPNGIPPLPGLGETVAKQPPPVNEQPLFHVEVPIPADLNTVTPVRVDTHSLTLEFTYNHPPSFYEGKDVEVTLSRVFKAGAPHERNFYPLTVDAGAKPQLAFTSLQSGTYSVWIHAAGAAIWTTEVVLKNDTTVPVMLQPGADVHALLKPEVKTESVWGKILQNGEPVNAYPSFDPSDGKTIYQGLPVGKYMLRIPSTKERIRESRGGLEQPYSRTDFAAVEVEFEVTADSPAAIDLGEILIPRER